MKLPLRDVRALWGRRGGNGRGGGQTKFYPYRKKRGKQSLSHAEGGGGAQQGLGKF